MKPDLEYPGLEYRETAGSDMFSKRRGFVFAIGASLFMHGLAVAAIYGVSEKLFPQKSEPAKARMVVVDLVSFKRGASSSKITRTEQKAAPAVKPDAVQKPIKATVETASKPHQPAQTINKKIPTEENRKEAVKGLASAPPPVEKLRPPQIDKSPTRETAIAPKKRPAISPSQVKAMAAKPATGLVKKSLDKVQEIKKPGGTKAPIPALVKPKRSNEAKRKPSVKTRNKRPSKKISSINTRTKKKSVRKQSKKAARPKRVSVKGQVGRGLKKKGKSKTGRTQGASYSGGGLSNPRPRYPPDARRRLQQGRVLLRVRVSASGRAAAVGIARSSGYGLLDRAARRAVRRWRFRPAMRNGKTYASTVTVPISFRLRN